MVHNHLFPLRDFGAKESDDRTGIFSEAESNPA